MSPRRSTAPIALLLTAGLICLSLTMVIPTSIERVEYPDKVAAGQQVAGHAVSTTDPASTAVAVGLLVLAVAAFAGAGWLGYRRRRS